MRKISIGEKIEQYINYLGYTEEEIKEVLKFDSKIMQLIYNNEYILTKDEQKKFSKLLNISEKELSNGLDIDEIVMNNDFIKRQKKLRKLPEKDINELSKFGIYLKKRIKWVKYVVIINEYVEKVPKKNQKSLDFFDMMDNKIKT